MTARVEKVRRKLDGVYRHIYRSSVTLIWNTWKNNPFRIPVLIFLILLTMTASTGLLYIPKTPLKPATPQTVLAKTYAYTPTSGTLVTGTETQVNAGAAAAAEGVNTGSWKGTLVRDSYHWIVDSVATGTPNLDVQLNFAGVQLQNANKMIIHSMFDLDSATLATQVQICDWASTTSVDYAADAQCTGGGWRILNSKNTSNVSIDITPTGNVGYQWQIYNGYWATGTTGGTAISTPLSNFIDGSGNVKIRYYSDGEVASNIAIDDLKLIVQIDPYYYPASLTQITGGTPSATYVNAQLVGNTASAQQNVNSGDANRLEVPGTAGAISDFYLSFKNVQTYTGANTIYARADYSCSATGINHKPKIYNFSSAAWEDLTSSAIACSTSDAVGAWAKNNVTIGNYISSNEIRIGWYGSANATTTIRLDFLYIMIGSTNSDSAQCEITFGSGTATNCTNTRDIDLTGTTATFDNTAADESNTYGNDFYPYDGDSDATVEEATASNINFPVTLPSGTQLTNAYYAARFAAGTSATAPALVVQPSLREYSSLSSSGSPSNGFNGGWLDIDANTSNSSTQANNDNIQMIPLRTGAPSWGMFVDKAGAAIVPTYFVDTVNNVMNMRLRSSTSGETTNNSVTAWDFAIVSISWVEDTSNPTPNRFSYVPTSDTLITGSETSRLAATATATSGGVNTGGWQGTLAQDGFQWVIAGANVVGTNYDAQLNLKDVKLLGANTMRINTQVVTNANIGLTIQICDWVSTTSVDAAADAQCTGGGWRSLNTKNTSNADVTITATSATTGIALVWNIYDGYWSTGTTGGTAVTTPLTNFVDATIGIKIRFYSTTQSASNLGMDYVRVQPMIDSNYQPASYTNLGSGTATGTYVNASGIGNTASASFNIGDDNRLQVPGTAGTIADFYLSYKGIRLYTGANTVLLASEVSCSTTGVNVVPAIYNFTTAAWEDLSTSAIACSTSDATYQWAKNNVTLTDYVAGGEARIRWYGNTASTLAIRLDHAYIAIGTTNTDSAACEITFGSGTATNCTNTRDLDTTGTTNTFDNPAEDESTTMGTGESNSYFVADNDQDAVIEEATASNVTFSLSLPSNSFVVASSSYWRAQGCGLTGNACGATALSVTGTTRYYDGFALGGTADGGWKTFGNAATSSMSFNAPYNIFSSASNVQWGQNNRSKPYNFLNTATGTAKMRLATGAAGTNTADVTTSWDFAMVSVSWLDIGSSISIAGSSNVDAATVAVAVDGVLMAGKTATVASSAWSISNVFVRNASTVIVWHDGATDANESTGVTVWDSSGNISGMVLTAHTISIGSADDQSNTPSNLGLYDYRIDEDVMAKYTGTTLAIDPGASYSDEILDILSGDTLAMGSDTLTTLDLNVNGTLTGTGNITATGNVAGTGTVTLTGGTFTQRAGSSKNFGTTSGSTAWTFSSLTFSTSAVAFPCPTITYTTQTSGSGGITVSSVLLVGAAGDTCSTDLNAGNRTWTLSGTAGDPFQILASPAGVLTASTSTFTYTGNNGGGNTTVQTATYYNLDINNTSETFVLEGTTGASNDLTITLGTLDTTASNYAVNVTRDMTVNGTFTANTSTITISRNWTFNTGATLNRGSSTVVMNGDGSILGSATTQFQSLSIGYSTKTTTLAGSNNRVDAFGTLTLNGGIVTSSATYSVYSIMASAGTYTPLVFASATTLSGTSVTLYYRAIVTGITINIAAGDYGTWNVNPYASAGNSNIWNFAGNVTTTGTFQPFAATGITGTTVNTQNFALTAKRVSFGATGSNLGPIALSLGSSAVTLSNGTSDAILMADVAVTHTLDMGSSSIDVKGNVLFVNGSASITVTPGTSTLTWTNTSGTLTYAPNGQSLYNMTLNGSGSTVTPNAAVDVDNNLTITAGTLTAPSALTIGGNYSNSDTFTHSSGTVTFNATDTGNTLGGTLSGSSAFYNLVFNGSGGEWTPSAAVAVSNDLTVTAGSLLGTQNLTVSGGDITGNGTINLTGGTTTLTGTGNFGGNTAWTFYTLKFGNTSTLVPVETTTATGTGGITTTDVLTINKHSGLGCDMNTLNAGSKTWTLSGTTGSPLVVSGTLTPSTSTVTFTGNNAGGNTNVPGSGAACGDATYNHLTLNNASETYAVSGTTNLTVNNNLTITAGTFTAGSGTTTVKGNFANSGTFTANAGTVTLSGTSTQTLSGTLTGSSAFYDLIISNSSGTDASDCERTGWVAGIDFSASATVTNNYTITTASVRVEYNNGSTYTINNMNWNGEAVGTRLYFRNSAVSGTWLLNVTAVGNAQDKVSYVDVGRSDASGGAQIIASDGTNTDCGTNTNWQFDETLTLGLDSTSKDFGVVLPGANPSDQTTTLTATSNAVNGYVIYGWSTQAMTNVRFGGVTIPDWTGTNATPTTFSAGSYGFGYTTDDTSVACTTGDVCEAGDRFASGTKFAGFTNTGPGKIVADRTAPATAATNTISYRMYPSTTQADGEYTTIIVYVIAAQFP